MDNQLTETELKLRKLSRYTKERGYSLNITCTLNKTKTFYKWYITVLSKGKVLVDENHLLLGNVLDKCIREMEYLKLKNRDITIKRKD